METKKVIEQGDEYDITINIQEGHVSLSQTDDLSTDVVIIRPAYTTEVAKAICPKYQETEDENKILKNQIELIFKNANNKIESLEQKNAKLLEALKNTIDHVLNRSMKIDIEATIELIHEAETKLKDNE